MPKNLKEPMVFTGEDLEPISVSVDLGGKAYTLRQATPGLVSKYEAAKLKGGTINPDGSVTLADDPDRAARLKVLLVQGCLTQDGAGSVPETFAQNLPPWVLDGLFERAKAISRIDQDWTVASLERYIADLQEHLSRLKSREAQLKN